MGMGKMNKRGEWDGEASGEIGDVPGKLKFGKWVC